MNPFELLTRETIAMFSREIKRAGLRPTVFGDTVLSRARPNKAKGRPRSNSVEAQEFSDGSQPSQSVEFSRTFPMSCSAGIALRNEFGRGWLERAQERTAVPYTLHCRRISMLKLPLVFRDGHLFVELERELWLFDTGAPTSFGEVKNLTIAEEPFTLSNSYMGLTAATLSQFVSVQCCGLLGADILGRFDHILDCARGTLSVSTTELPHSGQRLHLSEFMGIPILIARIAGNDYRMFFDTGAQISYFQDDSLKDFPACGSVTDFYPGFGQFQTDTHHIEVSLGGVHCTLRCGILPGLLGATLMMADTQGIIGNHILANRIVGYFPRRNALCL